MSISRFTVRNVMLFSLVAEGVTGVAVFFAPSLIAELLFGTGVSGIGVAYGRLLGAALLALVLVKEVLSSPSAR